MSAYSAILVVLFFVFLMMIMRWYFLRSYIRNSNWIEHRAQTEASRSAARNITVFTVAERREELRQENANALKDDLPSYEDALKLPKPDEVGQTSSRQPAY